MVRTIGLDYLERRALEEEDSLVAWIRGERNVVADGASRPTLEKLEELRRLHPEAK